MKAHIAHNSRFAYFYLLLSVAVLCIRDSHLNYWPQLVVYKCISINKILQKKKKGKVFYNLLVFHSFFRFSDVFKWRGKKYWKWSLSHQVTPGSLSSLNETFVKKLLMLPLFHDGSTQRVNLLGHMETVKCMSFASNSSQCCYFLCFFGTNLYLPLILPMLG